MLSLEEAQSRVLAAITPLGSEVIPLNSSLGRIVAQDVRSPIALPAFDNSAMDGFAVRAEDVRQACEERPVRLRLTGTIAAGAEARTAVEPDTAIRVFTGSPLPFGADAVVMQEDTRPAGEFIDVLDAVKPWENVRFRGEDVKRGETILHRGDALRVGALSLLAATGTPEVHASRKPVIAILSTGDELREPGTPLDPGKIYENNRIMLASLIEQANGVAKIFPIVRDQLDATRSALETAFHETDAVITTGGVSVGERDFVKAAFAQIGGEQDFWRVAIRPGKPFVFGRWREKFLFGLPGNPVSAFVTFLLLVRPALLRWQGANEIHLPKRTAVLGEAVSNSTERRHFMRVCVDTTGVVRSAGPQASHRLGSLARANGLLELPGHSEWAQGRRVEVLHWQAI
jgi:molybdopterin molybdotransferase